MFRTVPLSIIRSFSLYMQQWYMSYRFADSLLLAIYSQYSQRHVSASIPAILRVMFLVQEYSCVCVFLRSDDRAS